MIRLVLIAVALATTWPGATVWAQPKRIGWQLFVDGRPAEFDPPEAAGLDSLPAVVRQAVDAQRVAGYYLAEVDSVSVSDTSASFIRVGLFVDRGPQLRIRRIALAGLEAFPPETILDLMATRPGRVLRQTTLEDDVERILRYYERHGYAYAKVYVDSIRVERDREDPGMAVVLRIEEGPAVRINDIVLAGASRTRVRYIERLTGLRRGRLLNRDLDEVYQVLQASQAFRHVEPPELIRIGDRDVVIDIGVEEGAPGAFDLVMGYQPPGQAGASGLVGSGHLTLRNLFGGGRWIALRLNRLPGQVSRVEAGFTDPFVLGLPLGFEAQFNGLQQDSTYGQQAYRGALGYTLPGGLSTLLTFSREVTRPGRAGLRLREGRQWIPQSEVLFAGITVRFSRLDRPDNPRRGVLVETSLERGDKLRTSFERTAEGDTSRVRSRLRQERLTARARVFIPVFSQQVLAFGNETRVLVGPRFDVGDLFRMGGARSLRGYDEDRFRGRLAVRVFAEYRYLFERQSYAFVFFDLGYVDRPVTPGTEALRGFYPGYGLGIQFETGLGLINTSLALAAGEPPAQARVHVGLSMGL